MLINRNNYESIFLLYVDNELSAQEKEMVEQFVVDQADLKNELAQLLQTKTQASKFVAFGDFSSLLKLTIPHAEINETNCMDWLLLYLDNELDANERKAVEAFVQLNPHYAAELRLLQSTHLATLDAQGYGDKADLLRKEDDDRVIPFPWWRIAAAAIFIGILLGAYLLRNQVSNSNPSNIVKNPVQKENAPVTIIQPKSSDVDSGRIQQNDLTVASAQKEGEPIVNRTNELKNKTDQSRNKETKQNEENKSTNDDLVKQNLNKSLLQPITIENTNSNPNLQNTIQNDVVIPNTNIVIPAPKPQYVVYNPDAKEDVAKGSKNRGGRKLKRLLQRSVLGQEPTDEGEPKVTNIAFFQIETKTEEKKVEANEQKHK